MIELEENFKLLQELEIKIKQIQTSIKIESLKSELKNLENQSLEDNFWDDSKNSSIVFAKIKTLQKKIYNLN